MTPPAGSVFCAGGAGSGGVAAGGVTVAGDDAEGTAGAGVSIAAGCTGADPGAVLAELSEAACDPADERAPRIAANARTAIPAATITASAAIPNKCLRPSTTVVVLSGSGVLVGVGDAGIAGRAVWLTGVVGLGVEDAIAAAARIAVGVRCGTVISRSSEIPGGVGVASVGISPSPCGVTAAINAERNSSALWNRSDGDLASARSMIAEHQSGRSGRNVAIGVGASRSCVCTIAIRAVGLERQLAREQAVEHDADRVEIGAAVDLAAQHLLGRHVGRRAHHEPVVGQVLGARHARDAEVHHLDRPDSVIIRLAGLRSRWTTPARARAPSASSTCMHSCAARSTGSGPSRCDRLVERLAAHELHHHQQLAVVLGELVDRRDAGVIQPRERDRLGAEALQHLRVAQIGIEAP